MPERVTAIHYAIGSATRVTVLRYVLDHPGTTRRQLVDETGIAAAPAGIALAALEERGYVTADVDGDRVGKIVHCADRAKIADDASAFLGWLLR
ncbi:winged helix-turn-helix transcriptional regulator [Clavibacter sp. DM3]|nr:winged helix-turn-helix transcriptional regulator [Clavibacter zhangzhiyongii]